MLPAVSQLSTEEKTTLLQQIQNLKIEKAELIRRGCQATEDVMEKLNEALEENKVLKSLNAELSKENKYLNEDKSAQENLAAEAKMYSQMLEKMLDQSRDDPIFRPTSDETGKMEEMKKTQQRLQQEKDDLNDMMEEFKAMWSKDSKNFHETLKTVREEGVALKHEVDRLEGLRCDAETAYMECFTMKEKDQKNSEDARQQLLKEMDTLRADLQEAQNNLENLRGQKEDEMKAREKTHETNELLLKEVRRLRSDLHDVQKEKEGEVKARAETNDCNELLLTEVRTLRSNLQDAESNLQVLREHKVTADTKLADQEAWMQTQAIDLSSALSELFESRERTARQIQDMQECSRLKQDAYEQELAEVKRQKEDEKNYYEIEKTDLSDQLKRAVSESEALRYEYNYTVPALQEQLQMLRSESNSNYDRYVKYQTQTASLEESLKQSEEKRDRESEMFAATMDDVETQLKESKTALALKTKDHEQVVAKLQKSESRIVNLQAQVAAMSSSLGALQDKLTATETERAQLREQLAAILKETVIERERMEQKHEDLIAAVQKRFSQQMEEVKHNNMLAINQEMIKAQMALDSEKKRNALEYSALMKKLEQAVAAHEVASQQCANKIASLNQEVITLRNHNVSYRSECAHLKTAQVRDQSEITRLKGEVRYLEQATTEACEDHEAEVNKLIVEHQKSIENMGVEELDDDEETEQCSTKSDVKEHNDSVEWEMVDEE